LEKAFWHQNRFFAVIQRRNKIPSTIDGWFSIKQKITSLSFIKLSRSSFGNHDKMIGQLFKQGEQAIDRKVKKMG
jgi:hypothetical protein